MDAHSDIKRLLEGLPIDKLTRDAENDLAATIHKFKTGQKRQEALDSLVLHNMRDAFFYVRRCCRGGLREEDIYSLCYTALSHSAANFEPNRQSYFAFSKPYLRGQIAREWKKKPVVKHSEIFHVETTDYLVDDADNVPLGETWEEAGFGTIALRERIELIAPLFDKLTDREQKVLRLHFLEGQTLEEISDRWGLTRERVRQIKAKALRRIRNWLLNQKRLTE